MQVEHIGDWLYIYEGRDIDMTKSDLTVVGNDDPFSQVKAVKISSITSIKVDHEFHTQQIILYTPSVILLEFGRRNCYRINCFMETLSIITDALGLDRNHMFEMNRRGSQTALSVQRGDKH
jgi:hypothetical protein